LKFYFGHLCEISPYFHGLICVSLDSEGLETFERSTHQDIDLELVGSALGNSIILRSDKEFDTFMESIMFFFVKKMVQRIMLMNSKMNLI
jgi:hypothetical protein